MGKFLFLWLIIATCAHALPRCELGDSFLYFQRSVQVTADFKEMLAKESAGALHGNKINSRNKFKPRLRSSLPDIMEIPILFHIILTSDGKQGKVPLDSLQKNIVAANEVLSGKANHHGSGLD